MKYAAIFVLLLAGCGGSDDPPPPAQCWCNRPAYNAVTGRNDRPGLDYQCSCGSDEHRRYGR